MPIVFAPPSPAGNYPGLSIEAGKGQALMHDLPTLVRAMEAGQQAAAGNASRAQQAQIASAGLQQRDREFQQSQLMQAALADAHNQQQAEMQGAAMDQQAQMQQARLNQQMQMFLLEPTQRDLIRRTQLKGAISDIDQAVRDGVLTPEQAAGAKVRAMGALTETEQKMAAFKLAQTDEQTQMLQSRNKLAADMETQRQNFMLGNFDQLPLVTDPNTGKQVRMMMNHNGEWYDPFAKSAKPTGPAKLPPGVMTEAQFARQLDTATKMTDFDLEKGRTQDWGATFERNKQRLGLPANGDYAQYLQSRGFTQDADGNIHPYQAPAGPPNPNEEAARQVLQTSRNLLFGKPISQADKPVEGASAPAMSPAPRMVEPPSPEKVDNSLSVIGDQLKQAGRLQPGGLHDPVASYAYNEVKSLMAKPSLTPDERTRLINLIATLESLTKQANESPAPLARRLGGPVIPDQ